MDLRSLYHKPFAYGLASSYALQQYFPLQPPIPNQAFFATISWREGTFFQLLLLQSELASPKIKGSLNADEDIGVDEVSSAIDGVFDMGKSNVESMEVRSKFGEFSDNKKSVEEVVGVGEALRVGEDDDSVSPKIKGSLNADEDIGVDEVSSAIDGVFDMGESNMETLRVGKDDELGNAAKNGGDDAVKSGDISILNSFIAHGNPQVQYDVYTPHVLIPFLKHLNDQYIKKKKIKAAMQRRLWDPGSKKFFLGITMKVRKSFMLYPDADVIRDFYKKFYNSLGRVPNRCSSRIGKTQGLLSFSRGIGWEGLITV
ncbi:hypothetical protein Tco_1320218 [Tanacetum coccineum]